MKIIRSNKGQNDDVLYLREKDGKQFLEAAGSSGMQALGYGARDISKVHINETKEGDLFYYINDEGMGYHEEEFIKELFYLEDLPPYIKYSPSYIEEWKLYNTYNYTGLNYILINNINSVMHSTEEDPNFPVLDIIDHNFIREHLVVFNIENTSPSRTVAFLVNENYPYKDLYPTSNKNIYTVSDKDGIESSIKSSGGIALDLRVYNSFKKYVIGRHIIALNEEGTEITIGYISNVTTPGTNESLYYVPLNKFVADCYRDLNNFNCEGYSFGIGKPIQVTIFTLLGFTLSDTTEFTQTSYNYGAHGLIAYSAIPALGRFVEPAFLLKITENTKAIHYDRSVRCDIILKTDSGFLVNYNGGTEVTGILPKGVISTIYNNKKFLVSEDSIYEIPNSWLYKNFGIKHLSSYIRDSQGYQAFFKGCTKDSVTYEVRSPNNSSGDSGYGYGGEYTASEQYIGEFEE